MTKEEEFLKRLLATFKIEAEEHIAAISAGLIELEKQPAAKRQEEIIEVIFRDAHSLKGAARSVNLTAVETVCQAMESLFATLKHGEMALSPALFDLLNDATDIVNKLISIPDPALTPEERTGVQRIKEKLTEAAKGGFPLAPPPPPTERETVDSPPPPLPPAPVAARVSAGAETIRIPAARLDALLLQAEELISAKLAARQHANLARELKTLLDKWNEEWAKIPSQRLTIGLSDLLELNQKFSRSLESKLLALKKSTDDDFRSIGGMVDNLLAEMKSVMMFPFASILDTFPKLVRDLAREQEKEITLTMQGSEIEIDKRILQEIKDPLIHLLRNGLDHGLERKEARKKRGKPERGGLKIVVAQRDSGKVEIVIADDGAGIDLDQVKRSAVKEGVVTAEEAAALSRDEALALIFASGISTSAIITTLSGRGLGMAIVKEKIERLGGTIAIETALGVGTTFRILLPLSLATFRGILIQSGGQIFAVPTMNVARVQRAPRSAVGNVENRETICLNGKAVALVRLNQVLELLPREAEEDEPFITVMVLAAGDKELAFAIDEMLYEDEIVLKSLGNQLARVRNIAGATVLGSGRVILILNVSDLIKSALKIASRGKESVAIARKKSAAKVQSILVAEDSITARTLFVSILESAGYRVTAAVDGVDAFTRLSEGDFDLVATDVEMPRMNGFELTEKIRAEKRYVDLPVVIVTGLESPEDKQRGIEVGANAYIVKSSFDQSNLLEVVRRLI